MKSIELINVKKKYDKKTVVNINELSIGEKEIYGLIGPNGAGKSTIMKMICGLLENNGGDILIGNRPMNRKNRIELLKNIGSLIEEPSYYDNLTGYENLRIIKELKNLKESDIDKALEIVGLTANKNKLVKKYSLGMKQRLAIAIAIIGLPKIIILDEPTNGLDPKVKDEIRNLIKDLPKKYDTTVMVSSHDLDQIEKMVDKIGIIGNGHILYQGSIKDFKDMYSSNIYLRTSNNIEALNIINMGIIENDLIKIPYLKDINISNIIVSLIQNNILVYRIFEKQKSLEELFLDFTEGENL